MTPSRSFLKTTGTAMLIVLFINLALFIVSVRERTGSAADARERPRERTC